MKKKNGCVIPISLGMVNVYLIKGEKNILVDSGMPEHYEKIMEGLAKNEVKPKDVSLIIATHNHTDHTGGLARLKGATGARVAIHRSEAETMRQGKTTEAKPVTIIGKVLMSFLSNTDIKAIEPDILIDEFYDLNEYGIDAKVLHTPGHTSGSLTVMLSSGEAIVGDMFTGKGENKASMPFCAADIGILRKSIDTVMRLSPSIIYTSHGSTCTTAALSKLL